MSWDGGRGSGRKPPQKNTCNRIQKGQDELYEHKIYAAQSAIIRIDTDWGSRGKGNLIAKQAQLPSCPFSTHRVHNHKIEHSKRQVRDRRIAAQSANSGLGTGGAGGGGND